MTSSTKFFNGILLLLWSLHTGQSFMSISSLVLELWKFSFKLRLKRKYRIPEIGNTPIWVLPNIWRLGQAMDTTFGRNVCNSMLVNAENPQRYSFYYSWVIKVKPTGGRELLPAPEKKSVNVKSSVKALEFHGNKWVTALLQFHCFRNLSNFSIWERVIKTIVYRERKSHAFISNRGFLWCSLIWDKYNVNKTKHNFLHIV